MAFSQETKNMIRRKLRGTVVSDRMRNTCVVAITRLKKHPKYKKYFKVTRRFKVHDEGNICKSGDSVVIEETRPMSKEKRWKIVEKYNANIVK